jgi:hypothetical protein
VSQFEYVSVALALLYSFAIARLLTALPSVTARDRGYAIHAAWVFVVLLATVATWWTVWTLRDVRWTAWRFLWILSVPALIHLRAGILVSDAPAEVESWKEHYYGRRVPFFAVGAVQGVNALLIPWSMGAVPWFSPAPAHVAAITLMVISVVGLATRRPGVHGALVIANIVMLLFFLAIAGSGFDA